MAGDKPLISVTGTASPRRSRSSTAADLTTSPALRHPHHHPHQQQQRLAAGSEVEDQLRTPSPTLSCRLQVPFRSRSTGSVCDDTGGGEDGGCCFRSWCEDDAALIRACAVLARRLALPRSFSTGDMGGQLCVNDGDVPAARATSVLQLTAVGLWQLETSSAASQLLPAANRLLNGASRSVSTWVAVGDRCSTSQLPSPQIRDPAGCALTDCFTAADLVRSVNKKMRQNYIRRRLCVYIRAIQLPLHCDSDLQQLIMEAGATGDCCRYQPPPSTYTATTTATAVATASTTTSTAATTAATASATASASAATADASTVVKIHTAARKKQVKLADAGAESSALPRGISMLDMDRERGRPLTRYQKNMLVFNWLQHLTTEHPDAT